MKIRLLLLLGCTYFLSCQPGDLDNPLIETQDPIVIDSSFVPPVRELRFTNKGSYFFGPGDSGYYRFSADTIGNQFKVRMKEYYYYGNTLDSLLYTYRYDTLYRLLSIDRETFSGGPVSQLRMEYAGQQLTRLEERSGNTVYQAYTVRHGVSGGNRTVSIDRYAVVGPSLTDTISHALAFNAQNNLVNITERVRRTRGLNELWLHNLDVTYDNNDIFMIQGSQVYESFGTAPRKDSLWTTYGFLRNNYESPVLYLYLRKLYGHDLFNLLHHCDFLSLQNTPAGSFNPLVLPGQDKRSQDTYVYQAIVYTNGVQSSFQQANYATANLFDAQQRLIHSKVNSTPPNYFEWVIVYR